MTVVTDRFVQHLRTYRTQFRLTLAAVDGGHPSLRTYSELIIVVEDGPSTLDDRATPSVRRDRLSEAVSGGGGGGGRLAAATDQDVAVVVAVCVVTALVAAVLVAAIVFVGCHQRVVVASHHRLAKSSSPCYRTATAAALTDERPTSFFSLNARGTDW